MYLTEKSYQFILMTLHQQWQYRDATFETLHSSHLACDASPNDDPHTMPPGDSWTWLWCLDSSTPQWELKLLDLQIPGHSSRSHSRVGTTKCLGPWVSAADWNLWRGGNDPYQTPHRNAYTSCEGLGMAAQFHKAGITNGAIWSTENATWIPPQPTSTNKMTNDKLYINKI